MLLKKEIYKYLSNILLYDDFALTSQKSFESSIALYRHVLLYTLNGRFNCESKVILCLDFVL